MGNLFKKSDFVIYDPTVLTLMKLQKKGTTMLSMLPKGVFGCILEYCEPLKFYRIEKYKHNSKFPINYKWPEQISYHNPVTGVCSLCLSEFVFRLQSGDRTENTR